MVMKLSILIGYLIFIATPIHSQISSSTTAAFDILDKSNFKWNNFSFDQDFDKLKNECLLIKTNDYPWDYLNIYCGKIDDTSKSYYLRNFNYQKFSDVNFDYVILHLQGCKNYYENYSSLFFLKHLNDSVAATSWYNNILIDFKTKFGNSKTEETEIEVTRWVGKYNIKMILKYYKVDNLIILSIEQNPFSVARYRNNLYQNSEYLENFTEDFKKFDKKNSFKGLKFGMPISLVKTIVKVKKPDIHKEYEVLNKEYKEWYYINFDDCFLSFNKKGQLYDVGLDKYEFSDNEFEDFLRDAIRLFGRPNDIERKNGNSVSVRWRGKNFYLAIFRNENGVGVIFDASDLNDSSPSDKLY
jgi:hypothetical protein